MPNNALGFQLVILAVALSSAACSTGPAQVSVKLVRVITWPLTAEDAQVLSMDERARLEEKGIELQDTTLVFPEIPLVGYWVDIGGERVLTDENGTVTVSGAPETAFSVHEDFESTSSIGSFMVRDVAAQPQPAVVKLSTVLPYPGDMNPDDLQMNSLPFPYPDAACTKRAPSKLAHCALGDNSGGCCLDYDNRFGNGEAYDDTGPPQCKVFRSLNFIDSVCFYWSALSVCIDEAAFHRGPSCWLHHKYRNCQNLSFTDFSAVPSATVLRPGKSVTIKVRNNLPSNDTAVRITTRPAASPGTLANPTGDAQLKGSGTQYTILHYNDGRKRHGEETVLTYTAPPRSALSQACEESGQIDVELTFQARTAEKVKPVAGQQLPDRPKVITEVVRLQIICEVAWKGTIDATYDSGFISSLHGEIEWTLASKEGQRYTFRPQGTFTPTYRAAPSGCSITAAAPSIDASAMLIVDLSTTPPTYSGQGGGFGGSLDCPQATPPSIPLATIWFHTLGKLLPIKNDGMLIEDQTEVTPGWFLNWRFTPTND
jgi:hypothetical protein